MLLGVDFAGATLGIVGFGRIGQAVAKRATGFDMRILYYDPNASPSTLDLPAISTDLDTLLKESDFVSIHALLNENTRGLINRTRLGLMKPGSFLINLARGAIIESLDVLYDALTNGPLAGAALDVFEPEPPDVSHPIFKLDNCTR